MLFWKRKAKFNPGPAYDFEINVLKFVGNTFATGPVLLWDYEVPGLEFRHECDDPEECLHEVRTKSYKPGPHKWKCSLFMSIPNYRNHEMWARREGMLEAAEGLFQHIAAMHQFFLQTEDYLGKFEREKLRAFNIMGTHSGPLNRKTIEEVMGVCPSETNSTSLRSEDINQDIPAEVTSGIAPGLATQLLPNVSPSYRDTVAYRDEQAMYDALRYMARPQQVYGNGNLWPGTPEQWARMEASPKLWAKRYGATGWVRDEQSLSFKFFFPDGTFQTVQDEDLDKALPAN